MTTRICVGEATKERDITQGLIGGLKFPGCARTLFTAFHIWGDGRRTWRMLRTSSTMDGTSGDDEEAGCVCVESHWVTYTYTNTVQRKAPANSKQILPQSNVALALVFLCLFLGMYLSLFVLRQLPSPNVPFVHHS
jgi:hypothetical protein